MPLTTRRIIAGPLLVIATTVALLATGATIASAAPAKAAVPGTVRTGGGALNQRAGASAGTALMDTITNGARVSIVCQTTGQRIKGAVRTSSRWDMLSNGRYVSDAYIHRAVTPATCPTPAAASATPPVSVTGDPVGTMTNAQFIAASVAPAQRGQREFGVPASVTIAQAILESGWGDSGLTVNDRNFFGIKCFDGWPGPIASGCHSYATYECVKTKCSPTTATFRTYASATDSFRDHGRFLTTNSRYEPAFAYTGNSDEFLRRIWLAGYATSPTYYTNVRTLMGQYNLYQYDLH